MYIHQILNILLFLGIIELITWLVPSIRRRGSWNHAKGLSGDFNTCQDSVVLGHLTNRKYAIGVSAGDCFQCYLSTMERILLEMQRNGGTDWLLCALTSIDDEAGMYEQMEAEFSEALSSGHLAVMVTEGNIHSCFQAAQYYLHIPVTDTLQFADNFMDRINSFVGEISGNDIWYTINFSTIPNLGVLFKATYLHSMSDFNTSSPFSDVTGFINSMYPPCHPDAVDVTATCLQELGVVQLVHHPALMWLAQLVQTQEPWPWTDVPVIVNPPVVISSSLSSLPTRSLTKAYYYQEHLPIPGIRAGDTIYFNFTPPVKLESYFFRLSHSSKGWMSVGKANYRANMEGPLGDDFGKVYAARIRFTAKRKEQLLWKDIVFKQLLVPSSRQPCCTRR